MVGEVPEWPDGQTRIVDGIMLKWLRKKQNKPERERHPNRLPRWKCSHCSKDFKLGDVVLKENCRYYHHYCYDELFIDLPDISDEELEEFYKGSD